MATPLSANQAVAVLEAAGLEVIQVRSWRDNNRNHKGPWGPMHGVVIHHTGTYSSQAQMVAMCYSGHSELPGPLCHTVIDKAGHCHMVGWGRANHAGRGDAAVLAAVKNEEPLPADRQANADGNVHFYGTELINRGDGKDPWPNEQIEAAARWAAALCRAHGWTERSVIGHLEWQPGKIDPHGFSMDSFRVRVAQLLKDGDSKPPPKPKPKPKAPAYPGRAAFGPGKVNESILRLGQQLVKKGYGTHYKVGPSRTWGEADRLNVQAFQLAQKWSGSDADGYPGPETWLRLFA
ncbi:N-acetyl-anhydromuramyl-L-alanine amidase AmpD [Streptomyces sp. SLBN-118]|uniref:peptidoglycan-binding protein n=1 Tax=Streptomyces sp. SLBN-118 TaxID=2768454 RepID=UPI0011532396|nr:peptidoglycan-binding protein [Streptomyces sp. SLBN-118]TQK44396.1 N-acetyl-anhydromuramyl-L-alanine amidase AmpD [Streptomyces sp. SLBN-118]